MNNRIHIPARPISIFLAIIAVLLCALSLGSNAYEWSLGVENTYWVIQLTEFLSVTHEANLPTWFSSFLLLCAALLSGAIALAGQNHKKAWGAFSLLMLYLAIDETAVIHEMFTTPIREALGLSGHLYFSWVILGTPLALLVGLLFVRFIFRLPTHTRNSIIAAGLIYLSGALIVEAIAANQWDMDGGTSLHYAAISSIEEFLEMLGVIILINGLLRYIALTLDSLHITFSM
jgi:hypothetical protein